MVTFTRYCRRLPAIPSVITYWGMAKGVGLAPRKSWIPAKRRMLQFSSSWVATRDAWAYRIPFEALFIPCTESSEIATTETKKIPPATSVSRRVNPPALRTVGLVTLYLHGSVVEEDDRSPQSLLDHVPDSQAVGPGARDDDGGRVGRVVGGDGRLTVDVEADGERRRLDDASPGHFQHRVHPRAGKPAPVAHAVDAVRERR